MSVMSIRPNPDLSQIDEISFNGNKIGNGGFDVTVYQQRGDQSSEALVFLAPGFGDEDGASRIPLARALAVEGVRTALVKHTHRSHLANAAHALQQRSMNVHGATQLVNNTYKPKVIVEAGHSLGGVNTNHAANYSLEQWRHGDLPFEPVVVHEATPGLGDKPFTGVMNLHIGQLLINEYAAMFSHPVEAVSLMVHELANFPQKIAGAASTIGELVALREVFIQPGREKLKKMKVPVLGVFYRHDGVVPISEGCIDDDTVILDGGHLQSYYNPRPMVNFLVHTVLPKAGIHI